MDKSVLVHSLILMFATFISSLSQVILKKAAQKSYNNKIAEYLNPMVVSAYAVFFLATLLAIVAYRGIHLSLGAVLDAMAYIYVTIFGVKIFGEKMNKRKFLALGMIIAGIVIYAFTGS